MSAQNTNDDDRWTEIALKTNDDSETSIIRVSNPRAPLPHGLHPPIPSFVTAEEATQLLNELDEQDCWEWEGFHNKRKVQRYELIDDNAPLLLTKLARRFETTTTRRPQHVCIEEYFPTRQHHTTTATERIVTTFESKADCNNPHFVAQLPLQTPFTTHMHCPQIRRSADCWTLKSPDHWFDLYMEPNTLYLKTDECLNDWRSRTIPAVSNGDCCSRAVLVRFYSLPDESMSRQTSLSISDDGIDSDLSAPTKLSSFPNRDQPMPPLHEILTIVVTTSPIRSHPSTEVLERVFDTFHYAGEDFARKCRKVIVCDGCRILNDNNNEVSRKYKKVKQQLRNGIATTEQAENYRQFKQNLKALCETVPEDSSFANTTVIELETRHGYGFALRHALRHCVSTPYVCVIQHDRTFMRQTPVAEVTEAMWNNPETIKYVGMSMRSNLQYLDIFMNKYGKKARDELLTMILRPPELELDADIYGSGGSSATGMDATLSEAVQKSNIQLELTYQGCSQCIVQQEWVENHPPTSPGKHQLSLTPTLFWYDNTHICETEHYRDYIFNPKYQMVARGGFVEDKLSPAITRHVERFGLVAGHAKFGCYLLDDHSGRFFTGHLDGGSYLTQEQRQQVEGKYSQDRAD